MSLIGRNSEKEQLEEIMASKKSEFVVLYGRRRVGKTYLIKEYFNHNFTFYSTGLANKKLNVQLANFTEQLKKNTGYNEVNEPTTWMEAFKQLITVLEKSNDEIKLVFIDELPWMDTKNSDLITAVEFFWNQWASSKKNIKFIVCGSSASWMINNILKNKQGLYNRITRKIKVKPFTLAETQDYFTSKEFDFDHYQIVQLYMAFGGIPYYLDFVNKNQSAAQNINRLFFADDAALKNEYTMVFASLFKKYENHLLVIEALADKKIGLQRNDIIKYTKLPNGGTLSKILNELVESDFIRKFSMPNKSMRDAVYQLTDCFTLFYNSFKKEIEGNDTNYWLNIVGSSTYYNWAGNAFEVVGLLHVDQIKDALGISGIQTNVYCWRNEKVQIDLVIDRKDNIVNIIEMKFSEQAYTITKDYDLKLRNKIAAYKDANKSNKSVWLVMLTSFGLASVANAGAVHSDIKIEDLIS